jgi:phosphoribosyl 1,2-cyclic phosphate phosphodiesterase
MIGCTCAVCQSTDPRNYRRRSSIYVVAGQQHLLFDTTPDFRDQALRFGVNRVDAIFLTHAHADHIYGFDDVRRFSTMQEAHIPVFAAPRTIKQMRKKFDYVDRKSYGFQSVPRVQFTDLTEGVELGGCTVLPLPVFHGNETIYGYRIEYSGKRLAYIPDCNGFPDETFQCLENLDAIVLDGLRPEPHPTHFSTAECKEQLELIRAGQSFITHLTHNWDHTELQNYLGNSATVPWDGLEVVL